MSNWLKLKVKLNADNDMKVHLKGNNINASLALLEVAYQYAKENELDFDSMVEIVKNSEVKDND